ncbi:MAG TPA: adenylate/guanylate cyclase domain-containing protein [Planctomycetaceae bacterium]|nr:adenylate/guanylate cyclase domain-containing protein [Planctomycetaceae bacterium]
MPQLIARGQQPTQHWSHTIPDGKVVRLGRAPQDAESLAVPWDYLISRDHADVCWQNGCLQVRQLPTAKNPIYYHEKPVAEFELKAGEEFRIGQTRFRLDGLGAVLPDPRHEESSIEERSFGLNELRNAEFGNSADRLEVLARLPRLISKTRDDDEFATQLVELLLAAIPRADAAAVVGFDDDGLGESQPSLFRGKSRSPEMTEFRPSQGLMRASLTRGESVVHVWNDPLSESAGSHAPGYTATADLEWAFSTPISGQSGRSWCLYVSGSFGSVRGESMHDIDDLKGDIRFSQLLAQFIGAIRRVRRLEHQQVGLAQFFSPKVMESLTDSHADVILEPRESEITVLFCDVRGFSRKSERARHNLRELLNRVSSALGVMTRSILTYDGVVADFQGDAALGFWGWPVPTHDGPLPACRAALVIQNEFRRANRKPNSPLFDFRVGIGIAYGTAIAGKIGTDDQAKVGAFGPVVNLGSRLESMTKHLRAPILIDEITMNCVKEQMSALEGRCRRLGRIRPYGMDEAVMVAELLPPADEDPAISDEHIADFEAAVDAVSSGDWSLALRYLDRLPATDRAKDFLMIFIALNEYEPPPDWDGVITMPTK